MYIVEHDIVKACRVYHAVTVFVGGIFTVIHHDLCTKIVGAYADDILTVDILQLFLVALENTVLLDYFVLVTRKQYLSLVDECHHIGYLFKV